MAEGLRQPEPKRRLPDKLRNAIAAAALIVTGGGAIAATAANHQRIEDASHHISDKLGSMTQSENYGTYVVYKEGKYSPGQRLEGITLAPDKNGDLTLYDSPKGDAKPHRFNPAELRHVMAGKRVFTAPLNPTGHQAEMLFKSNDPRDIVGGNISFELTDLDGQPIDAQSGKPLLSAEHKWYVNMDNVVTYKGDIQTLKDLQKAITTKDIGNGMSISEYAKSQGLEAIVQTAPLAPANSGNPQTLDGNIPTLSFAWDEPIGKIDPHLKNEELSLSKSPSETWPLTWNQEVVFTDHSNKVVKRFAAMSEPQTGSFKYHPIKSGGKVFLR